MTESELNKRLKQGFRFYYDKDYEYLYNEQIEFYNSKGTRGYGTR